MNKLIKTIKVSDQMGRLLTGKFNGRQHFATACRLLAGISPDALIILDFKGAEYVSASWINAMILPLIEFAADDKNDFYVVVRNFPELSRDDLQLIAEQNSLPVVAITDESPEAGLIYGSLDAGQRETLNAVVKSGEVTGATLATKGRVNTISGAAWNNRLRDLNVKRLLRRRRVGREQIYSTILSEMNIYG